MLTSWAWRASASCSVHAADEAGDADHTLKVDLHDVKRGRVRTLVTAQLQRELVW